MIYFEKAMVFGNGHDSAVDEAQKFANLVKDHLYTGPRGEGNV